MEIRVLPLGDYQTNCYLIWDEEKNCAVIDPGDEPERVLEQVRKECLQIKAILLTHGHFDHVGGVRTIAQKTGCAVYLHEKELELPSFLTAGPLYHTDIYKEGDCVFVGSLRFSVLETPGHTMGSVCLRCGETLFTGDTLFAGSCGRTDLGGSWAQLSQSLARLSALKGDFTVYPGHGESTTLQKERESNPYMGRNF